MSKNAVICGVEHALRDEGCNEIPVAELYARVRKTRGNFDVSFQDFMIVLKELEKDGLFESFGEKPELSDNSLIARSQKHPSVPYGDAIHLGVTFHPPMPGRAVATGACSAGHAVAPRRRKTDVIKL